MFDVGFWELTFIMTLALLVLGPDKLPGLVRSLGRWMGRARSVARNLRVQIEREVAEIPNPADITINPRQSPPQAAAEPDQPVPPPEEEPSAETDANTTPTETEEKSSEPGTRF